MRKTIHTAGAAVTVLLLACGIAKAGDLIDLTPDGPKIGMGILCNTSEQAQQFVGLLAGGQSAVPAMNAVNTQAHDPRACALATVAFIPDATLATKTVHGRLVQIVRINVVAGYTGSGWQRTAGMVQYAVVEPAGESI